MFDILKSKIESWSHAKLIDHAQYLPITPLGDRNVGFFENDSDSLHIIKKYKVISYNNDNTIAIMINLKAENSTKNDFDTIKKLYKNGFNIVEPIYTKTEKHLQYTLYKSPNQQLGIPFIAEYFSNMIVDKTYVEQYISEITTFIKLLTRLHCLFPEQFVGVENRLKNDIGYYYFNLSNFNSTKDEFIQFQLEYLQIILNTPIFKSINNAQLLDQARQQWQ